MGAHTIEPVHLFLGLLKSVDIDLNALEMVQTKDPATVAGIASDLADIRVALHRSEIQSTLARRRLRRLLGKIGPPTDSPLRRSSSSRMIFSIAEAFVGSGLVRPIHLLSILAEVRFPYLLELFEDSLASRDLLLEVSTLIALSRLRAVDDIETGVPARNWMKRVESFRQQGWTVSWSRKLRNKILFWHVEISREEIRRIVQAEDISAALLELERALSLQ